MAIKGVDYNLLLNAAKTSRMPDTAELVSVLNAAAKGQTEAFDNNNDLIAQALTTLINQASTYQAHRSFSATFRILKPKGVTSQLWGSKPTPDIRNYGPQVRAVDPKKLGALAEEAQKNDPDFDRLPPDTEATFGLDLAARTREVLNNLTPSENRLLQMRFGTSEDIPEDRAKTHERIRDIEARATQKPRRSGKASGPSEKIERAEAKPERPVK